MRSLQCAAALTMVWLLAAAPSLAKEQAPAVVCQEPGPCRVRCEEKNSDACMALGELLDQGATPDPGAAARAFQLACELGNPAGCLAHALAIEQGEGASIDRARAREAGRRAVTLYEEGCQAGDPDMCRSAVSLYLQSEVAPRNAARATALHKREIALREPRCRQSATLKECAPLIERHDAGIGNLRAPERAVKLAEELCKTRGAELCVLWAELISPIDNVPEDQEKWEARVLAPLERACLSGEAGACEVLLEFESLAKDGARSGAIKQRLASLRTAACSRGDQKSCARLAAGAKSARPGAPSPPTSPAPAHTKVSEGQQQAEVRGSRRSCERGDASACDWLGEHYQDKDDAALAARYLLKACKLGDGGACWTFVDYGYARGRSEIRRLLGRACSLREHAACNELERR